ncbi:MAG: hypothetical protein QM831_12215 [Kofleriaceae bacterium]
MPWNARMQELDDNYAPARRMPECASPMTQPRAGLVTLIANAMSMTTERADM